MSNDEFEELCRRSWEEVYNYICFDRSKKRDQAIFVMRTKTLILNVLRKRNLFEYI